MSFETDKQVRGEVIFAGSLADPLLLPHTPTRYPILETNGYELEISRQIGFLRFPSLDESREFIDRNFPFIHLYGKSSKNGDRAAKIRIAFSKEREDRRSKAEGEWICQNVCCGAGSLCFNTILTITQCSFENFSTRNRCFRCQATRSGMSVS